MEATTAPPAMTLSREEVCCLKTALALVVLKRRHAARRQREEEAKQQKPNDDDNKDAPSSFDAAAADASTNSTSKQSLYPWLMNPAEASTPPASAQLVLHLDYMMQQAFQATNKKQRLIGLATHLRQQLLLTLDDIIVQAWVRRQLAELVVVGNNVKASARVWTAIVQEDAAVDLALRVVEELIPALKTVFDSYTTMNDDGTLDTYGLFQVLDTALLTLMRLRRFDAVLDCVESLTDYTTMPCLSKAYVQTPSLPILWLRLGLQQLLTKVMAIATEKRAS
jgi:hypothetical protein